MIFLFVEKIIENTIRLISTRCRKTNFSDSDFNNENRDKDDEYK